MNNRDKYCPFIRVFNPPCDKCMFALENSRGTVACCIAALAADKYTGVSIRNFIETRKNDD